MPMPNDPQAVTTQNPAQPTPQGSAEKEIAARLATMDQKLDQNSALMQMMADPDIRAVMEAKVSGKKIKVSDLSEPQAPAFDPQEAINQIPDNADPKVLFGHLLKVTDQVTASRVLPQVQQLVQQAQKPLLDRLSQFEGMMQQSQEQQVTAEIKRVSAKYEDFDELRPQMVEMNKQNPNLPIEDLYRLVALRTKGKISLKADPSSERPTGGVVRPSLRDERGDKQLPKGARGFEQLLREATARIDVDGRHG